MKKKVLPVLALFLILLSGCEKKEKEVVECTTELHDWLIVKEFNYSGHTYIMFKDYNSYRSCAGGVIHSPECKCYGKKNIGEEK